MLDKTIFEVEKDGFYGIYYPNPKTSHIAMIAMLGDSCDDFLATKGVKWLHTLGLNVLAMSPAPKDYNCHNLPIERFDCATKWLLANDNRKVGILGASTTGMLALLAASYYPDITMTIAISPSDFVMEGYYQEKGVERPGDNESTVSFKGQPLPYLPFAYRHPEYWEKIQAESKRGKNMVASREMFDESERLHPVQESERIKVEMIHGTIVLLGAEDDCLWDTCRYIRRMEKVLQKQTKATDLHILTYQHGTHFLFPQSMLEKILPVGSSLLPRIAFKAARDFPKECLAARKDADAKIKSALNKWMK